MNKTDHDFPGFDLAQLDNHIRVPIPRGAAVYVMARKEQGTWSAAGAKLRVRATDGGMGLYDFASTKEIAAGGGAVAIASAEMEARSEIEVRLMEPEAGPATCFVRITVEEPGDAR